MVFSNQTFQERFATMGDPAEDAFRRWAPTKNISFVDYGLKRPPFKRFYDLPEMVKATPDFLCEGAKREKFLVECKGTGGRAIKIKLETLAVLQPWVDQMPVYFFMFDSNNLRCAFGEFSVVKDISEKCKVYEFPLDKKQYYSVPTTKFNWENIGDLYASEEKVLGY